MSLASLLCKTISKRKHCLYPEIGGTMETKLARISQLSSENPDMVFTSIGHLINKEMLKDCHEKMDGDMKCYNKVVTGVANEI